MSLPEPKGFDDVCGKSVAVMCCVVAVLIESRENATVKILVVSLLVSGDFWISGSSINDEDESSNDHAGEQWTTTTPRMGKGGTARITEKWARARASPRGGLKRLGWTEEGIGLEPDSGPVQFD